jgi:hypothetical protein
VTDDDEAATTTPVLISALREHERAAERGAFTR